MKRVAIVQSNYIPWKGYFDLIASVDEFILFDDMQYTRRDWRNRNKVKVSNGLTWLTVPVRSKGNFHQPIREIEIDGEDWSEKHWLTLKQSYGKAKFFDEVAEMIAPLYLSSNFTHLSVLNRSFIEAICQYLGVETKISNSWDYEVVEGKSERLASLCAQAGGTKYVSGPSAKGYVEEDIFGALGISVSWFDYAGYPPYPQLWGEFVHEVSILDLLFNCGKESGAFMRFVNQ